VTCSRPDGSHCILAPDNGMTRLAAHEIDHIDGRTYVSRMRDGVTPIAVAEYRGTGHARDYPAQSKP
jgi:peptide deformylase